MKTFLHSLIIAICAAGVFFSQQGNVKFNEQKAIYEQAVRDVAKLDGQIKVAEKELFDEEEGLTAAKTDLQEKTDKLAALVANENVLVRQRSEVDATLTEQAATMKIHQETLEKAREILRSKVGAEVTLDNLPQKIEEIENDKKAKTQKLEELVTLVDGATKDVAKNNSNIADLSSRKSKRDKKIGDNAKEAVITAVDGEWGFVVIGAGSNVGFTPQTKLLVKRNGVLIGRISPTSIEPTQTIAEIDRDSLAAGASLQVGDRVILAVPATQ